MTTTTTVATSTNTPRRSRRLWLWAFLILIFGSLAGLYALSLDDEPPNDADLRAVAPLANNSYAALLSLREDVFIEPSPQVTQADDDWFGEEPFPQTIFAAYLAENAAVLDRVVALSEKPLRAPVGDPTADLFDFKEMARWLAMRARVRAREGRSEDAFKDAFAVMALGSRMERDAASVIDWLIGLAVRGIGAAAFEDVLGHSVLDGPALVDLDRRVAALPDIQGLGRAIRNEYLRSDKILDSLNTEDFKSSAASDGALLTARLLDTSELAARLLGTPLHRLVYKPNRTRALYAELTRLQARTAEGGERPAILEIDAGSDFEELSSGNAIGRAFLRTCSLTEDNFDSLCLKRRQGRLERSLLRTLIALRRFRLRKGRWPESLSELSPRFLPAVPVDLDDKPIRYRPDLTLIYSVGSDLEDDLAACGNPDNSPDRMLQLGRRP